MYIDWNTIFLVAPNNIIVEQASLSQITEALKLKETEVNMQAMATAKLARLTYNMNRSSKVAALEDVTEFLPYPKRYLIDKASHKIRNIPKKACTDYIIYYNKLPSKALAAFKELHDALVEKG